MSDIDRSDKDRAEDAVDALSHIVATCNNSRTQTRRLRWIKQRAISGIEGTTSWTKIDLPYKSKSAVSERMKMVEVRENLQAEIVRLQSENEALKAELEAEGSAIRSDSEPSSFEAFMLRKQAEAIEESLNGYFTEQAGPANLHNYCRWYARRLRQQAEAAEKAGGGDESA